MANLYYVKGKRDAIFMYFPSHSILTVQIELF